MAFKPHLKKADSDNKDFANSRPISHLSYVSKVLEWVDFNKLLVHIENNSLRNVFRNRPR